MHWMVIKGAECVVAKAASLWLFLASIGKGNRAILQYYSLHSWSSNTVQCTRSRRLVYCISNTNTNTSNSTSIVHYKKVIVVTSLV